MKEILADIERWRAGGRRVALARVVQVDGSAPREAGATMAVSEDGEVAGSVSGGCVEGAVVSEALEVLATGHPRLCGFGYSDDDALNVGLTCGGTVSAFVQPFEPVSGIFEQLRVQLLADEPVALATLVEASGTGTRGATMLVRPATPALGSLGDPDLDSSVHRDGLGHIEAGTTAVRHYGTRGEIGQQEVAVFIQPFTPPPRIVIFGAVDFSAALARVAKVLGYRVTVCDARPAFATADRFPMADEVVVDWPDRHLEKIGTSLGPRDAVCVLTHDPKFDVPALVAALATQVGYIGAMGSRQTTARRNERLHEVGIDDQAVARIMAPIGLDIGARTPEQTAVSICAEIVALRCGGGTGSHLRTATGPIHRPE